MKPQLLEYLVRACVKEVLTQVNEKKVSAFKVCDSCGGSGEESIDKNGKYISANGPARACHACGGSGRVRKSSGKTASAHIGESEEMIGNFKPAGVCTHCKQDLKLKHPAAPWLKGLCALCSSKAIAFYRGKGGFEVGDHDFMKEDDETKGAPAPPADGQGTGDQPALPKEKNTEPEEPSEPETPPMPSSNLKGVVLVNPRDKSKLQKVPLQATDDAALERDLHRLGATIAGPKIKTSLSTMRSVKDAIRNPNSALYLYIGKYDPDSDDLFLMCDKSLKIAKDSSVPPEGLVTTSNPVQQSTFSPLTASDDEFAQQISKGAQSVPPPIDEVLRQSIKKMVDEMLDVK